MGTKAAFHCIRYYSANSLSSDTEANSSIGGLQKTSSPCRHGTAACGDRWERNLQAPADIGAGLALFEELLSGAKLAEDLYSYGEASGYVGMAHTFNGLLLAKSGRSGSSATGWFSFWSPRQTGRSRSWPRSAPGGAGRA